MIRTSILFLIDDGGPARANCFGGPLDGMPLAIAGVPGGLSMNHPGMVVEHDLTGPGPVSVKFYYEPNPAPSIPGSAERYRYRVDLDEWHYVAPAAEESARTRMDTRGGGGVNPEGGEMTDEPVYRIEREDGRIVEIPERRIRGMRVETRPTRYVFTLDDGASFRARGFTRPARR